MINKLTGESVSKETLETIERLMRGENVNMETIDNLKEIKDGYSRVSQDISTHLLENREGIREEVLDKRSKKRCVRDFIKITLCSEKNYGEENI